MRVNLSESRYYMYLYIAPWKILLFLGMGIIFSGTSFDTFFVNFGDGWREHAVNLTEVIKKKIYYFLFNALRTTAGFSFNIYAILFYI